MTSGPTVVALLEEWRSGDTEALDELMPIVYEDLKRIAAHHLKSERSDHTLQPTALVNEAFVRLSGTDMTFEDRARFLAIAARTMRRILTDYGRARMSQKRGAGRRALTLHEEVLSAERPIDIVELDDAIERFGNIDERKSDILVLHYFGGMTHDEIAEALDISAATVDRELRFARAWLGNELKDD